MCDLLLIGSPVLQPVGIVPVGTFEVVTLAQGLLIIFNFYA